MAFSFNVNDVLPAVQFASQVIAKKNSMPILDNVLLDVYAEKNQMFVTGSDMETEVKIPVPIINASEDYHICVNASRFAKVLSRLSGLDLKIVVNAMDIRATYNGGDFTMAYEQTDAYPRMQMSDDERSVVDFDDSKPLSQGLKSTLFATANDEIRPVMTGVYFDLAPSSLTFVGTDGRILVRNRFDCNFNETKSFILPKKPATILQNLIARGVHDVKITFNDKHVWICSYTFSLTCRLIEGHYPNYNSVIPTHFNETAIISRDAILAAISRISVFAPDSELMVLSFTQNEGKVSLSCQDVDYSTSAEEKVDCEYVGGTMKIGLKVSLLDALLRSLDCEQVLLKMDGATRAVIVEPQGSTQETPSTLTSLIMPMKID